MSPGGTGLTGERGTRDDVPVRARMDTRRASGLRWGLAMALVGSACGDDGAPVAQGTGDTGDGSTGSHADSSTGGGPTGTTIEGSDDGLDSSSGGTGSEPAYPEPDAHPPNVGPGGPSVVFTPEEVMADEHLNARGVWVERPTHKGGSVRQARTPVAPAATGVAPKQGQDSEAVLREAGFSDEDLAALRAGGAFG